jgi:hypothetical protein
MVCVHDQEAWGISFEAEVQVERSHPAWHLGFLSQFTESLVLSQKVLLRIFQVSPSRTIIHVKLPTRLLGALPVE